ncbi:hypothetical protein E1264_17765 [Actinomadura sp. KC216]|uniref:hypothetical protein n=1 Tax=Actinomadura sp. KC216 TaxID=2530370 RepID=UPI0010459F3E|nr:hypothetical protein [Actinomadura sp. KC216]TDB86446.1 hypothetical protein E1264_17765 [Actinomadura sp. KC216]
MRLPKSMRKWGIPIGHLYEASDPDGPPSEPADVVAQMPDPDQTPASSDAGDGEVVVVEHLDVPPERRPWDTAVAPVRQPAPTPNDKPVILPHCNGRHGIEEGLARCEWCDALTDLITAHKALVQRVVDLERQVAELIERDDRRVMDGRRS